MVRIRRDVEEVKRAGSVGQSGAVVAGDLVIEFDCSAWDGASGGVGDKAIDSPPLRRKIARGRR